MKKKILSCTLALAMALTSMGALTSYAEQAQSQTVVASYEDVLLKVKSKINVADDMTEFDMDVSENANGEKRYYFYWQTSDDNKYDNENLSVVADADGNILRYYAYNDKYSPGDGKLKIADISKAEVLAQIENQLKVLIPEKFERLHSIDGISVSGNEYYINYVRIENGLKVYNNYVNVSAVLYDGNVYLQSVNTSWDNSEFTIPDNTITYEQAAQLYKDKARFYLNYGTSYQSADKYKAFLQYSFENTVFIDAVSGECLKRDSMRDFGAVSATENAAMDADASSGSISPAEKEELDTIAGLISYADAEKTVRAIDELEISDEMTVQSRSIINSGEEYIMHLTFCDKEKKSYRYVSLNAKNGDLYSASNYSDTKKSEKELSEKEKAVFAEKITAFVQKYVPEYYKAVSATEPTDSNGFVTMHFERLENDVPVANDGITVTWNAVTDKFTSLYAAKTNITEFESTDGIIAEADAYEMVLTNAAFEKIYIKSGGKMQVAYSIVNTDKDTLDAIMGEVINYRGIAVNTFDGYNDTDGHWAQGIISTLADYGVRKYGGEFKPDESITQKEFLSLLCSAMYTYTPDDEDRLYNRMVSNGVLAADDINPQGNITKQQAVVYLLNAAQYKEVAQLKNIFKCDFADCDTIGDEYLGYIAIAKGMGIVNGDESNNFNPDKDITNAEAAVMLYNYLKR